MAQSLAQKLQIKPGRSLLLLNPPAGAADLLGDLAAGSRPAASRAWPWSPSTRTGRRCG